MATYTLANDVLYVDGLPILQATCDYGKTILNDFYKFLKKQKYQGYELNIGNREIYSHFSIPLFIILSPLLELKKELVAYGATENNVHSKEVVLKTKQKQCLVLDSGAVLFLS